MIRPVTLAAFLLTVTALGRAQQKLQFEKYTLPNGMTVVLHEDHSLPVVAVDVWYKVGSKDESARRTGFAHLFEHLMFMGTKRVPNGRFDAIMEAAGGENNASTTEDRTEFHESGPSNLLPTLLWLEADRLETLGRDVDAKKLDLQRNVVENEIRQQVQNKPYGRAEDAINALMFPPSHPYGHPVYGSFADLDAATVGDVKGFFDAFYAPNNAILAVVGDFKPAEVKAQIAAYFGSLPRKDDPPRPALAAFDFAAKRVTMVDRVPQAKITFLWHSPAHYAPGDAELDLLSYVLGSGVSSRLYGRLVADDKLATDVDASQDSRLYGSLFQIDVTAAEGADLDKIEAAVDDELRKLQKDGPTTDELDRVRAQTEVGLASAVQSQEALAQLMTESEAMLGSPDGFTRVLADQGAVTPTSARDQARKTFDPAARLVLRVVPDAATGQGANPRDTPPPLGAVSAFAPPAPVDFTLRNGLRVHYWQRPNVPLVSMALLAHRGAAGEPLAKAGASSIMADLLSAGAGARDAETFEKDLDRLGASFSASAGVRATTVGLTVLERNLGKALPIFADALGRPRFDPEELDRTKRIRLADLQEETTTPARVADKVAREAFFGAGSPLGKPVEGTPATVPTLQKADVEAQYRRILGPASSELFVAGGLPVEALKKELQKALGDWKGGENSAASDSLTAVVAKPLRVLIVNRPGAVQTNVRFLFPAPALRDPNYAAAESAVTALGGSFTSRLMQNLREDKGYTYGAGAGYHGLSGVGYTKVSADVRSDATGPALKEFLKEFARLRGGDVTPVEVGKSAQLRRAEAIQSLGTLGGLLGQATGYAEEGLPLARLGEDLDALAKLDASSVNRATKVALQSDQGVLVLVGDRATIEKALVEAGLPKGEEVKG